jgi:hypothetical protein
MKEENKIGLGNTKQIKQANTERRKSPVSAH